MKTNEEILDLAVSIGLQVVETCDNGSGYPSGIQKAIIGFDLYAQAEKFIEHENNCEICLFKIWDGHHFYQNLGRKYEPLSYNDYLNDLGGDYRLFDFDIEFEGAIEGLKERGASFEDYAEMIERFGKWQKEIETTDDCVFIYNGYSIEECPLEMMSYREDVYSYVIGVAIRDDD